MDKWKAQALASELTGKPVGGWTVDRLIGAGKSAAVFVATNSPQTAAIKVFDRELVDQYGRATQLKRIERELRLRDHDHPHVVKILDGGECPNTGLLYVVMEFLEGGTNLAERITTLDRSRIGDIIRQVAAGAEFLESLGLAHRDIKPENIWLSHDATTAVLLDLGVIRPFGEAGLTDENARPFIGTLRYSSPEYLSREEMDSTEGWRAVTFYQIGAVLHDLITRRPLFEAYSEPFTLLVQAVLNETPEVAASDVPPDLVLLARKCLIKDPRARTRLVAWADFGPSRESSRAMAAKDRVTMRGLMRLARGKGDEVEAPPRRQVLRQIGQSVDQVVRFECAGAPAYPRFQIRHSETSDVSSVTVTFEQSADHDLCERLQILFECALVDEATVSVEIRASAHLGSPNADSKPVGEMAYRGPLDSEVVGESLRSVLWIAFDCAQRLASLAPDDRARWLNLGLEGGGE